MISRSHPTRRSRLLPVIAALAIAAAGVFAATPASAHDALVSTDPAADTTLDASPEQLTLAFSAELLAGAGNEVQVTDAAGASLADGAAVVDGTNLVQPLVADGSGVITVVWRAVSSDGHPISGQYAFTVAAPPAPTESATEEPSASPEPEPTASAPIATDTPTTAPSPDDTASPLPWIIGGVAVLLVAGAVVALLVARARRSDDVERPDSDETDDR